MIRLVTLGTSTITHQFASAVRTVPGIDLAGVYSRDAERADETARALGAGRPWSDLDALLASPDVDAVYIASPNAVHAPQCRAALEAGKHVIVEKPATLTAAEFASLAELARGKGLVLIEAMRSAYDPGMAAVRDLLPRLGVIRRVAFEYCQRSSRYDLVLAGERVNIFDPALGGGVLNDLGVYVVSALVDLFGEPARVTGVPVMLPTGADGAGVALAEYPGMVAELAWSKITASERPSQVEGELGTLTIDHITNPTRLTLTLLGEPAVEHVIGEPGSNLRWEIERFVQLVAGEDDPSADQERTLGTLRTMEAVRASWI